MYVRRSTSTWRTWVTATNTAPDGSEPRTGRKQQEQRTQWDTMHGSQEDRNTTDEATRRVRGRERKEGPGLEGPRPDWTTILVSMIAKITFDTFKNNSCDWKTDKNLTDVHSSRTFDSCRFAFSSYSSHLLQLFYLFVLLFLC